MNSIQPSRILVIDDNEAIHSDFRKILGGRAGGADVSGEEEALFGSSPKTPALSNFELDSALQGEQGHQLVLAALAAGRPYHVAFVDMRMPPGWDGVQTIKKLWEADPRLQIVICSAYSEYSFERIVQNLGVTDRLLVLKKPFDALEVSQIATALAAKWHATAQADLKVTELEELVQERTAELKQAALVDRLTGLPNRELLHDRLEQLISRAKRDPSQKFAVLFLDFDRFKVVNDSLGHRIGDLLLITVAERLRSQIRVTDTLASLGTAARLGGDEFVIVLDRLREYHDAARVTERLLEVLNEPYLLSGHAVHATASVGVTTSGVGYTKAEDMIRDADIAMYRAKAAGRARYMLFDQQMHTDAVGRLTLENELRMAIERNEFSLQYQPIVSLRSGAVVGFEALARWQNAQRGPISPAAFIPLAEEIGFIVPLGYWVLETACRQLAEWKKRLPEFAPVSVSVNLSPKQMSAPDLTATIAKILAASGLDPEFLKLEITESAIMENPDSAVRLLNEIRAMGIELHMDDFGTGYSSLSCLHRFPISVLKIDRAFVKDLQVRPEATALIKGVVNLSHDMNIKVVAEGLEQPEQIQWLRGIECDLGQGFGIARPAPPSAAEAFMLSSRGLAKTG